MSSDESLTGRGIRPDLRETAREAARRKGLTVEEWLQSVIVEQATQDGAAAPSASPRPRKPPPRRRVGEGTADVSAGMAQISSRLDDLTRQLDSLAHARKPAVAAASQQPRAESPATVQTREMLSDLDRRLERLMQRTNDRPSERASVAPPRSGFAQPSASRASAPPYQRQEADTWASGLDLAVAEIAERQRFLDDDHEEQAPASKAPVRATPAPTHSIEETAAELENQLRTLTDELKTLRRPDGFFGDAIAVLRNELSEIGRKIAEAAPRRALQALETEVRTLVGRIDETRQKAGDTSAIATIESALADIRGVLAQLAPAESLAEVRNEVRLLDRKVAEIGAGAQEISGHGAVLRGLVQSVAELREAVSNAASGDALVVLAEELQGIGEKIDRLGRAIPTASDLSSLLDRRFHELAAHLEGRAAAAQAYNSEQLGAMVDQIASRFEHARIGDDQAHLLDAIAQKVARVTDHIEAGDSRTDAFGQIERTMTDLLAGMERVQSTAVTAAERAAKATVLEMGHHQRGGPEMDALRQNLDALRHSQVQSDQRTQDTLEAVHDTLERLVDRLALVETGMRSGDRRPLVEAPPSTPRVAIFADDSPSIAPAIAQRAPLDTTLPADHPLEPGSKPLRPRAPVTPAERIAASEAVLGDARPEPAADAKSNFIAAARRAAQAAANMSPPGTATDADKPSSTFAAFAKKFSGRHALLLGVILLIGAGALHVTLNGLPFGGGARSPEKPAAKNETMIEPKSVAVSAITPATVAPATPPLTRSFTDAPVMPAATPAPSATMAPPAQTPSAQSAAATPTAPNMVSSVSPLTIASIQLPRGDVTNSVGRATGLPSRATAPAAPASASEELPSTFSPTLRAAAAGGNAAAEYEVGLRFVEGRGVQVNLAQAAVWLERAANRGVAPAQYRLGSLYEKGQGVRKDLDQARRLYRAASDRGNAKAMHNLAVLYAEGIDGKPDFAQATQWFRKAALHGVADSQYNLGILHARGLGVEQSLSESYRWFALAAQQGDQDAGKKRDEIAGRLDPQALAAAKLATQNFVPEPQPEDAMNVPAPPGGWDQAAPKKPTKTRPAQASRPRQVAM